MSKYDAVFFDLDGTLVDTAPDLAYAINQVLTEYGKPEVPLERLRSVASDGSPGLIRLAFNITPDMTAYDAIQKRFIELYQTHITRESTLFDGMQDVLVKLEEMDMKWGVITNKPEFLTTPLMAALSLDDRAVSIVSADTTPHSKPHPAPMLYACAQANVQPERCLYIGDAKRDIEAGNNTEMTTLIAAYGYIKDTDSPEDWQADGIIEHPRDILNWL